MARAVRNSAEFKKAQAEKIIAEEEILLKTEYANFRVNKTWLRKLYDKTFYVEEELEDEDGNEMESWRPPLKIIEKIIKHFKDWPYDKIRMGVLKIEDKHANLVWFEPNEEQAVMLADLETCWKERRAYNAISLKSRQVGLSTFSTAINYCILSTQDRKRAFVMANKLDNSQNFELMIETFRDNEPWWMRPDVKSKKPLRFFSKYLKPTRCVFATAENRDSSGRSNTMQFVHLSEIAFWPEDFVTHIISSVSKICADGHGRVWIEESTGKQVNDDFYRRCMQARNGGMPGFHYYFFPWFHHGEYQKPLWETGWSNKKDFLESLSDEHLEMVKLYDLTPEQINWYIYAESQEVGKEDYTIEVFRREYPSCEKDAFMGLNSNYFEPNRNEIDAVRTERPKLVTLAELPDSSSLVESKMSKERIRFARAELSYHKDGYGPLDIATMFDSSVGKWLVWERPRPGHTYVISADPAVGKQLDKKLANTSDYSVIDVWRITYDHNEQQKLVQVAQLRVRGMNPFTLADEACAMAKLYATDDYTKTLIIGENNAHGLAFVEQCKRREAYQYMRTRLGKNNEVISEELGFMTTGGTNAIGAKSFLYSQFNEAWKKDYVLINSHSTAIEMGSFANRNGSLEAIPPNHDDTVTAAALAMEGVHFINGINVEPRALFYKNDLSGEADLLRVLEDDEIDKMKKISGKDADEDENFFYVGWTI